MRFTKAINLKEGDWIFSHEDGLEKMEGKFIVGRVEQIRVIFDESYFFKDKTMEKKKYAGAKINQETTASVLNKSDLKKFNLIKKKMEMLEKLK